MHDIRNKQEAFQSKLEKEADEFPKLPLITTADELT